MLPVSSSGEFSKAGCNCGSIFQSTGTVLRKLHVEKLERQSAFMPHAATCPGEHCLSLPLKHQEQLADDGGFGRTITGF